MDDRSGGHPQPQAGAQAATEAASASGALPPPTDRGPILLFDGVCNLCSGAVQFLIRRDRRGRLRFASLQSAVGRGLLARHGLPDDFSSLVLVEGPQAWRESSGALRATRYLKVPWPLAYWLGIGWPRFLRDAIYRWIARNRYRWFGQKEACWLPRPEWRARFLDAAEPAPSASAGNAAESG